MSIKPLSKEFKFYQSIFNNTLFTTKKLGLSQCFKTVGIALKSLGIGQKHLFWCFFSWCFLPLRNECGNRSAWPTPALFQTTSIGPSGFENLFRRFFFFFFFCWDILHQQFQDLYWHFFKMKTAGIGVSITAVLKSLLQGINENRKTTYISGFKPL